MKINILLRYANDYEYGGNHMNYNNYIVLSENRFLKK